MPGMGKSLVLMLKLTILNAQIPVCEEHPNQSLPKTWESSTFQHDFRWIITGSQPPRTTRRNHHPLHNSSVAMESCPSAANAPKTSTINDLKHKDEWEMSFQEPMGVIVIMVIQ